MLNRKCGLQLSKSVAQNWIVPSGKHDKTKERRMVCVCVCACACVCVCEGEAEEGQTKHKLL